METFIFGNKNVFSIKCSMYKRQQATELSMYVGGKNILAYEKNGKKYTTRWNLDSIAEWLRHFIDNMTEDPYPVQCQGHFAAEKDVYARNFDSDDEDEFDAYYDALDEWNERHRWHTACDGAILADVYFQLVGNVVEISWNNQDIEDDVVFSYLCGGKSIDKNIFYQVVNKFLQAYADFWFSD